MQALIIHGRYLSGIMAAYIGSGSTSALVEVIPGSGPQYYVSTAGSDSNTGLSSDSAHAWRTLQHAANQIPAGGTLNIEAGSYAGFSIGSSTNAIVGTSVNPVIIQGAPGTTPSTVIINSVNPDTPVGIDIEPGCAFISIKNLTVTNISASSGNVYGIKVAGSDSCSVVNCIVSNCTAIAGIQPNNATNVVVSGCTVYGTLQVGGAATTGHGIYMAGDSTNGILSGNLVYNNAYIGIHVNNDNNGALSNAIIQNNIIHDNGQNAINCDGPINSLFQNNLIYNFSNYGIVLYASDGPPPTGNRVINNTIVVGSGSGTAALRAIDGYSMSAYNNILLGGSGLSIQVDSTVGITSDYNVSGTSSAGAAFSIDDGGSTISWSAWKSSPGQDAHDVFGTLVQLFTNASSGIYTEVSGSPAIGAGTHSNASSVDILGVTRPNPPSIGAYDYPA